MGYSFSLDSLEGLVSSWPELSHQLKWEPIFVLPPWLKSWWSVFGSGARLFLGIARQNGTVIGVAPLKIVDDRASFIGDAKVCDYLDFVIRPGKEAEFFNVLLDEMKGRGIARLDLAALRPDSTVLDSLVGLARERHYPVSCRLKDVSLELDLPQTWQEYLAALTSKQRHEVRRKLRRLEEVGTVSFCVYQDSQDILAKLDIFIRLFRQSRRDKARFMNAPMRSFFKLLAQAMAQAGLLRLGFLELNSVPVAAVTYIDYNNNRYLYNSGYDPEYGHFSVGLLAKVLCIKDSIEQNKSKFDFLKGGEVYKYYLGGRKIPLYHCKITIK